MPLSPSASFARRRRSDGVCRRRRLPPRSRRAAPRRFLPVIRRRGGLPLPVVTSSRRSRAGLRVRPGRQRGMGPLRAGDASGTLSRRRRARSIRDAARELADSLYADLYGSTSGVARGSRCCATFTAAAAWPRGCVPCSRSVTSTACAPIAEPSRYRRSWKGRASPAAADPDCQSARRHVAFGAGDRHGAARAARSVASSLLLRAAADAGANRHVAERARGHHIAAARADAKNHSCSVSKAIFSSRGLKDAQIARCFECATEDVGATSLDEMLDVRSG